VVTLTNVLVRSPDAVTTLLSQMPIELSKMRLRAILTVTGVPPENMSTPVVLGSVGLAGASRGLRRCCSCRWRCQLSQVLELSLVESVGVHRHAG
jgi:hypothetical protein